MIEIFFSINSTRMSSGGSTIESSVSSSTIDSSISSSGGGDSSSDGSCTIRSFLNSCGGGSSRRYIVCGDVAIQKLVGGEIQSIVKRLQLIEYLHGPRLIANLMIIAIAIVALCCMWGGLLLDEVQQQFLLFLLFSFVTYTSTAIGVVT